MIRLPQTRAFTGGEEHGAVHPDQAIGEHGVLPKGAPQRGYTTTELFHQKQGV